MEKKLILQELCSILQNELNRPEWAVNKRIVEFFSGLKPCGYYLPAMHIGTTESLPTEVEMAWFVEVAVDGKVVFRESQIPKEGEDLKKVEEALIGKILFSIFSNGIMLRKEITDKYSI